MCFDDDIGAIPGNVEVTTMSEALFDVAQKCTRKAKVQNMPVG